MLLRSILAAALLVLPLAPALAGSTSDPLAQDYNPAPAMWKLSDEDTTIYLFGSIHVLPEGFRWRNAQFDRIVAEADTLVLESNDEDATASLEQYASKLREVGETRRRTSERLAPPLRRKWRMMIESTGRVFDLVDAMPLPLVMLGFDGADGADDNLSRREFGVETVLTEEFTVSGRPIESIENTGAVMLSLVRMDDEPILNELAASLALMPDKLLPSDAAAPDMRDWSVEHAWARGEVDPDFGFGDGKAGEDLTRVLLDRRNSAWSRWLQNRLDQPGTILVAVGAGHFEGQHSVHYFLEQRGLRAERIN